MPAADDATQARPASRVVLQPDGSVQVVAGDGAHAVFRAAFTLIAREDDPKLKNGWDSLDKDVNLVLPKWWIGEKSWTYDIFKAGRTTPIVATQGRSEGDRIIWTFPAQADADVQAELVVGPGEAEPQLSFSFTPRKAGWYTLVYAGAPACDPATIDAIWQPRVWQEKRFPNKVSVSTEIGCSLPVTLVSLGGTTTGVAVDPAEIPFRMPTIKESRFGVAVRNGDGQAQPQVMAPLLGFPGSQLAAGETFRFRLRLSVRKGGCYESFKNLSEGLYRFRDQRENTVCSLNQTLDTMIDYALHSRYSGWDEELKALDYTTDVKHTVKLVSALHPLSLAALTDSEEIFAKRARPMIEYLWSREKYLFTTREGIQEQNPSNRMTGPAGEAFEWSSLYRFGQDRTPAFLAACRERHQKPKALNLDTLPPDTAWISAYALWQATGDEAMKAQAMAGADAYITKRITTPQTDFTASNLPGSGQFPTDFVPRWMVLFSLYEATGERRYLDAAVQGARLHAAWCWTWPTIPDGMVTVNQGGVVKGMHGGATDLKQAEETVPAWWLAPHGMAPEASNTYLWNPAVFLANHAPWMLRLAEASGDMFLRSLARNAVVGRYASYPGYTINRVFTTVCMKPDYPSRDGDPYHRYNQLYLNHVWPQIAMVTDWLFSEAEVRSRGRIRFPSRYAQGYVYLQSRVYGDRPGRFFDDEHVRPWLPPGLLSCEHIQVNHIAGHGNGRLYLAFVNQSDQAITTEVTLDARRLGLEPDRTYRARLWSDAGPCVQLAITGNRFPVALSGRGITSLAIDGITVDAPFQKRLSDQATKPLGERSHVRVVWPLGEVRSTLMSFGRGLSSAYVFLTAEARQVAEATLHWRIGDGAWRQTVDKVYPFEFTIPLDDADASIEWRVEVRTPGGGTETSPCARLER